MYFGNVNNTVRAIVLPLARKRTCFVFNKTRTAYAGQLQACIAFRN